MNTDPAVKRGRDLIFLVLCSVLLVGACSMGEARDADATEAELLPVARKESGSLLHASGFEPGWTLDIYDDRMVYVGRYGEERVVTARPELLPEAHSRSQADEQTYVAHTDAYEIRVHVLEVPCSAPDGRGPFELTVVLDIGGQEYRGCGSRG